MTDDTPEIVKDVHDTAQSLETQKSDLQDFRATIDGYVNRVSSMTETERSAFYDSAERLQVKADEATTVDDVLALQDEVEAAIRKPLEQVAAESLREFLSVVDVELLEETKGDVFDKLSDLIPQDLETVATAYQNLTPKVSDLPSHLRDSLETYIEKSSSRLLTPTDDIKTRVEQLEQRYNKLEQLESKFDEAGPWAPDIAFLETDRFYDNLDKDIQVEHVVKALDSLQNTYQTLHEAGVPVEQIINSELEESLSSTSVDDIVWSVRSVKKTASSIASDYNDAEKHISTLDTFGTDEGVLEDEIDELLAANQQLKLSQYSSLQELESDISDLNTEIDSFINTVHVRLKSQRKMVSTLESEGADSAPTPKLAAQGSLIPMDVEENLHQALKDCAAYDEWISTQLQTSSGDVDRDEILNIWLELSEDKEVPLTDDNEDAVMALADRLSLSVVLRSD